MDIARRYALVSLPLLCGGYQLPPRLLELSLLHGNVVNRAVVFMIKLILSYLPVSLTVPPVLPTQLRFT